MPSLMKGHNYLLMISHFSGNDQSGYALSLSGGTAVITDSTQPRILGASVGVCGATTITVALNKNMQCASLAADGSDFLLSHTGGATGALPPIIGATGNYCNSGFDMDTVTLTFSAPIPQGNYLISAKSGTDGNTILDLCNNGIPVGDSVSLLVGPPPPPAPFDSLSPLGCTPSTLTVVFNKNIQCNSVAADGSDFRLTGAAGVSITGAACGGNPGNTVVIQLSGPIYKGGANQLELVTGSDGNTLIDQCSQQLPAGQFISLYYRGHGICLDRLPAVYFGCKIDSIDYSNPSAGVSTWNWTFDSSLERSGNDQEVSFTLFLAKKRRDSS